MRDSEKCVSTEHFGSQEITRGWVSSHEGTDDHFDSRAQRTTRLQSYATVMSGHSGRADSISPIHTGAYQLYCMRMTTESRRAYSNFRVLHVLARIGNTGA